MAAKAYLDHHTATRPLPSTIEAMLPFLREHWGCLTSPHAMGQELIPPLNHYTESILNTLGATPADRFYFFSSHAEAISQLFLIHYFDRIRHTGANHLLTTNIEEASVLSSIKRLEEMGCAGKTLLVNSQGQLTNKALEEALRPRVSLFSLSWANGLTGVVHPLADLAALCQAKEVRVHVDASYVIGKLHFRFEDLPIDFMTFDGSLIHAPKGTAGLLVKEKTLFSPPQVLSSNTPVGGVAALSLALQESVDKLDTVCLETARLRDKLEMELLRDIPGTKIVFSGAERLPNCTSIIFPGVANEALLFFLNRRGVYATLGGGQCQKLSHILLATGHSEELSNCALSFSLSFETTEEEIDYAVKVIIESVAKLKNLSYRFS